MSVSRVQPRETAPAVRSDQQAEPGRRRRRRTASGGGTTITLRHAESAAALRACFPVMRELRPHLADAAEFAARAHRQAAEGGYRLLAAWDGAAPVGLAGYRMRENLIRGRFCYVDDLVVTASARRSGLGAMLLDGVAAVARAEGVPFLVLDTGLDNLLGQRFYFRYGMLPAALRFAKPLVQGPLP